MTLLVVVPKGGGDCHEIELTADPKDSVEKLKRRIESTCGIPADDLELFAKNTDAEGCKQCWLAEGKTLEAQDVRDRCVITVGVHGMKGGSFEADDAEADSAADAVRSSICRKGDASYYHAHRRKGDELPEEMRIAAGGPPRKMGESSEPLPEPVAPGKLPMAREDGSLGESRPERRILSYAWGDEKDCVKVYVSAEQDPEAVAAAGDGKSGEVEVTWAARSLKLRIHTDKFDWVLELERIYYEIVPDECRFRVSQGKRVTLSLKKKESFTWLKLLKPENN